MRQNIVKAGYNNPLSNPIQKVTEIGKKIERLGCFEMTWENLGDPVAAGESPPKWISEIIKSKVIESYDYTDPKGCTTARKYILENISNNKICTIDDILMFNGVGDAINKIMSCLPKEARVLLPDPCYTTYATAESINSDSKSISYPLDPLNNWDPDLEHLEKLIKYNERIVAILIINPNNPTGRVYSKNIVEKIVSIAKNYGCFIIADEIYHNIVFGDNEGVLLEQVVGDVPGISLKGISKEVPWPGSRCGWAEFFNVEKNLDFKKYVDLIFLKKSIEMCSTTLPQKAFPEIYSSPEFNEYLTSRIKKYDLRATEAFDVFSGLANVRVVKPEAVFFMVVELLNISDSTLSSINKKIRLYLDKSNYESLSIDFKFCYELMGSKGVCVLPLSGFSDNSSFQGFRFTLLQGDDEVFSKTIRKIADAIEEWYE